MTALIRLAIIGLGKIANDQHVPAVQGGSSFDLVATVSHSPNGIDGVPHFKDIADLAGSGIGIDAVAICTPPQVRRLIATFAIDQGWHVCLEKPPSATLAEIIALRDHARSADVSLFAGWHSRYADGVEPARAWLAKTIIRRATITWREDVRVWHPGQDWIWAPGGFGVFDPGINALSIATHILPRPLFVESAEIDVPGNWSAPIAARIKFCDTGQASISMDLDFRQEGPPSWVIDVESDAGSLSLSKGGAVLSVADQPAAVRTAALHGEYPALYERFAAIIRAGISEVDLSPLRLVADTFLRARINTVDDFY